MREEGGTRDGGRSEGWRKEGKREGGREGRWRGSEIPIGMERGILKFITLRANFHPYFMADLPFAWCCHALGWKSRSPDRRRMGHNLRLSVGRTRRQRCVPQPRLRNGQSPALRGAAWERRRQDPLNGSQVSVRPIILIAHTDKYD